MKETEYYNGDILEIKETIDTFNQYKETNPEIKALVEEHGDAAEALGAWAVSVGLNEKYTQLFISGSIDIMERLDAEDTDPISLPAVNPTTEQ